ncbi:hypothetical protein TrLO_g9390 [Triparma laevis f. longispina]|uniref:RNA helicase n=1 Tax=Triparma laevis f. longispina TaxID=1714387 RepID=A0A9W7FR14_9STRA|nr:hypothetical protein TrLO_g9390 [Triparma laevis f. longispina]
MSLKKSLKKAVKKGTTSLSALAAELGKDEATLKSFITSNSKKFTLNGDVVSLNKPDDDTASPVPSPNNSPKKRKVEETVTEPTTTTTTEPEPKKKKDKKEKKEKKEKKSKKSKEPSTPVPTAAELNDITDLPAWRKINKIVVMPPPGKTALAPYASFAAAPIRSEIKSLFTEKKFQKPSPIQAQCWPIMMANNDIVGIAETGSGKTLAFSVPALEKLKKVVKPNNTKPKMLVLAPTRELAQQSYEVLEEFGSCLGIRAVVIFGGIPKYDQSRVLKRGVEVVVATPGRLKDLCDEGVCDLSEVEFLVLDEADRMLDMGFEQDVRYIISMCKEKEERQTAMFSATWPASIQKLAQDFLVEVTRVYVGFEAIVGSNGDEVDDSLSANKRVAQTVEVIEDRARDDRIKVLLEKYHGSRKNRVLVFALYKKEAARLEQMLSRNGWKCCSIHGDKSQDQRTAALQAFKDQSNPLLIATDVAARGLDIPDVECVINYTFPLTIEDYVHRIGRTGRAGKTGISHTFFQPGDKSHAGELQQVMKQAGQKVPEELMKFGSTIKKKEHKLYGNFGPKGGPMKKATKIVFD